MFISRSSPYSPQFGAERYPENFTLRPPALPLMPTRLDRKDSFSPSPRCDTDPTLNQNDSFSPAITRRKKNVYGHLDLEQRKDELVSLFKEESGKKTKQKKTVKPKYTYSQLKDHFNRTTTGQPVTERQIKTALSKWGLTRNTKKTETQKPQQPAQPKPKRKKGQLLPKPGAPQTQLYYLTNTKEQKFREICEQSQKMTDQEIVNYFNNDSDTQQRLLVEK